MTRTVAGDDIGYRSRNISARPWAPSEIEPHRPDSWPPPVDFIQLSTDLRVRLCAAVIQSPPDGAAPGSKRGRDGLARQRAQDGPADQDRQHFAPPLRIDADVRQRPALLVRAATQLLGQAKVRGAADQLVESL